MRRSKERVFIFLFVASVFGLFALLNVLKHNLMLAFLFGFLVVLALGFSMACKQVRVQKRERRVVVHFCLVGFVVKQESVELERTSLLRVSIKHLEQSGGRGLTVWQYLDFIDTNSGSEKILLRIKEHNATNKQNLDHLINDLVGEFKLRLDDQR